MSNTLITAVYELELNNPLKKFVLVKLADQASDDGICWPSYKTIAKHTGMSERTVQRHIHDLHREGLIRIEQSRDEKSGRLKNKYFLKLRKAKTGPHDTLSPGTSEGPKKLNQNDKHGDTVSPDNLSSTIRHGDVSRVTQCRINPHKNPHKNPKESGCDFDWFWKTYNKSGNKVVCKRLFANLSEEHRIQIRKHLPGYVASTPEVKFRKNPENYLKSRMFIDVPIKEARPLDQREPWQKLGFQSAEAYDEHMFQQNLKSLGGVACNG